MSLRDVLNDERHDLDSVENPLVEALPKSIRAIAGAEMQAFETDHLEQTKGQVFGCARRLSTWGRSPPASIAAAWEAASRTHPRRSAKATPLATAFSSSRSLSTLAMAIAALYPAIS